MEPIRCGGPQPLAGVFGRAEADRVGWWDLEAEYTQRDAEARVLKW